MTSDTYKEDPRLFEPLDFKRLGQIVSDMKLKKAVEGRIRALLERLVASHHEEEITNLDALSLFEIHERDPGALWQYGPLSQQVLAAYLLGAVGPYL